MVIASRSVCKFWEGFAFPGAIQVADNAEHDPIATGQIREAAHGTGSPSDFAKGPFDDVGGAYFLPVRFRSSEEIQQDIQIAFDAFDGLGPSLLPGDFPLAEGLFGFAPIRSAIDRRSFRDAAAFPARHFVGDVAHLVRPAELDRHSGKDQRECGA